VRGEEREERKEGGEGGGERRGEVRMDVPKSMLTHVGHLIWLTECFISLVKRVKQGHKDVDEDSKVESYARPGEHLTGNGVLESLCCGGKGRREIRDEEKRGEKEGRRKRGGATERELEVEKQEREREGERKEKGCTD